MSSALLNVLGAYTGETNFPQILHSVLTNHNMQP